MLRALSEQKVPLMQESNAERYLDERPPQFAETAGRIF